ncbi:hypothetical protein LTR84_000918 [Exophiala bonariae]|uniref:Ubiquitin-like protease family profile domain-containing protein n=1 Tax=Exophiala bonariae TaxID=1690606 RepID=A0AAV9NS85_9EURO|nr:hypothetical protein LTR84_000918 [Exophiala bonariae]
MDDYVGDRSFDSRMDWTPQKADPPFNPYPGQYMPGGWPATPPPQTTGVFARPRPPGVLFPAAKRVCHGLASTSQTVVDTAAVPVYGIVRRVRRQQHIRQSTPQRPTRTQPHTRATAPLTESPWLRANAYHDAQLAAMQAQVVTYSPEITETQAEWDLPDINQVQDPATDESKPYIMWNKRRRRPHRSVTRPHPALPPQNSIKRLYGIPDLIPKSTVGKNRSPIGSKEAPTNKKRSPASPERKLDGTLESTMSWQDAVDSVSTPSGPRPAIRGQVSDPTSVDTALLQASTDTRHGPSGFPRFISLSTNTTSANSSTKSAAPPNGINLTNFHSNSSVQHTDAETPPAINTSLSTSSQQLVDATESASTQASNSHVTDQQLVEYLRAIRELETYPTDFLQQSADFESDFDSETNTETEIDSDRNPEPDSLPALLHPNTIQQQGDIESTNALDIFNPNTTQQQDDLSIYALDLSLPDTTQLQADLSTHALDLSLPDTTQQLVDSASTTALSMSPSEGLQPQVDVGLTSALNTSPSKSSQPLVTISNGTKALTPHPIIKAKAEPLVSLSPSSNTGEYFTPPRIRHRRVEVLSSARKSPNNFLITESPESDISSSCPFSPGNPGWDLPNMNGLQPPSEIETGSEFLNINNTMHESIHHEKSQPNLSLNSHCGSVTPLPSIRVTGGGSPIPNREPSTDLGRDSSVATGIPIDPLLFESPGLLTIDDNEIQTADTRDAKVVVTQPISLLNPNSLSSNVDETQESGPETQQRDPEVQISDPKTQQTGLETQHSGPETPQGNIISIEQDLYDLFDPSDLSDSIIVIDSPIKTPSNPPPRTPEKAHRERESGLLDSGTKQSQLTESSPVTPERALAQLNLDETFDPSTSTPKAGLHSDARDKRVTRAEAKRLELLKEVQQYSIGPLDEEWESRIQTALKNGHDMYKATDLLRVVPLRAGHGTDNWLNDEVINGYLKLVTAHGKRNNRPAQTPTHHAFASFFYTNLASKGYESVRRWALKAKIGGKNLLETEQVFIPINSGMHWTLCVVSGKEKTITHYNSLSGNGQGYVNTIKDWVKTELGTHFVESEWAVRARGESPQQANMDDCGVFAITSARQIMLGLAPTSYNASQIPLQRKRIIAELINGELIKSNEQ